MIYQPQHHVHITNSEESTSSDVTSAFIKVSASGLFVDAELFAIVSDEEAIADVSAMASLRGEAVSESSDEDAILRNKIEEKI